MNRLLIVYVALLAFPAAFALRADAQDVPAEEAALRAAAEHVADSVVQIRTIGGLDTVAGTTLPDGPTTGLVISADGFIVSSAFNFVQQPTSILVTLPSGKQAPAELVATDHSRMLVLLKVTGVGDLPVPAMAPINEIRPGQWAVAIGRTFRADHVNISVGIVSALNRMFGRAIQTDAAVSAANYGGALVDLRGRVMGIIVPMAPQGASEVAGAEWYDSGIGFAVPLEPLLERVELMKKGEDQRPGILGIGLAAGNPHATPAKLATVRPDSPAGQAGFKKDDRIIEIDGRPIRTQTDLRFALGTRYGGETIKLIARRGDERVERDVTLVGELPAFRHAFLGILPMRPAVDSKEATEADEQEDAGSAEGSKAEAEQPPSAAQPSGVGVRMTYEGSPAAEAGIQPGDRIVAIDDTELKSIDDAVQALNNSAPGSSMKVQLKRDGEALERSITVGRMPTGIPSELPPARRSGGPAPAEKPGETIDLKLPEFPNECKVYVPQGAGERGPMAMLLCLQPAGKQDAEQLISRWQSICDRDGVLLVVPSPAEGKPWEQPELEYLRRLLARVLTEHSIDRRRVVVYGEEEGGAMAWLLGLAGRDVFRGIAVCAAPLPRQVRVPPNEPSQRLAVFSAAATKHEHAARIADGLEKIARAGHPVTTITAPSSGSLSDAQLTELARWIDTLDRF